MTDDDAIANGSMVGLLSIACTNTPDLPAAACRGSGSLFEQAADGNAEALQLARDMCDTCRCLRTCQAWAASLPLYERHDIGVLAGVVITDKQAREAWAQRPQKPGQDQRSSPNSGVEATRTRKEELEALRAKTERRRAERRRQRLARASNDG